MCFLLTLTDYQFLIYFSIKIKYRQKVCLEKPYLEDYNRLNCFSYIFTCNECGYRTKLLS